MNSGQKFRKQLQKCNYENFLGYSTSKIYLNINNKYYQILMLLKFFSEILHEDRNFNHHELAALVASKVYYHLGSFEDSLTYALGAGELFDVNARNEYVDTTIGMFMICSIM